MNDHDLLCVVIEQLLDTDTLTDFAATQRHNPPAAAADLSRCTPAPVVTSEYTVSATPFGVLTENATGRTASMSWDRIGAALAGAGIGTDPTEIQRLNDASGPVAQRMLADIAHRAAAAAGFEDIPVHVLSIEGCDVRVGFDNDTATVHINDTPTLSVTPWENVAAANVAVHDYRGAETKRLRVQFVPPGYARPGVAAGVADRVSVERLDNPDPTDISNHPSFRAPGGKLAVQVDGYDLAIIEVGAVRMRTTIYDQDPRRPFLAHEAVTAVPAVPGTQRPSAAERLAKLCERPSAGKQRGLER